MYDADSWENAGAGSTSITDNPDDLEYYSEEDWNRAGHGAGENSGNVTPRPDDIPLRPSLHADDEPPPGYKKAAAESL